MSIEFYWFCLDHCSCPKSIRDWNDRNYLDNFVVLVRLKFLSPQLSRSSHPVWDDSQHFVIPLLLLKWSPRNEHRKFVLMTCDQGSASYWSCRNGNLLQPIRSTTQIWVVTYHWYGISVLVLQAPLCGKTNFATSRNVNCFLRLHHTLHQRYHLFYTVHTLG